jgi:CubicO group peptidase (beta-lactamase class C family)
MKTLKKMKKIRTTFTFTLITALVLFTMTTCIWGNNGSPIKSAPAAEPYEWPVSTPEEQGLHSNIIATALEAAREMPYLHSLLIVRNGRLVGEGYFHGYGKYDADNIHSASKSVTAILIGIALKENYLAGLDMKMMDFFPEYAVPGMDPRKYDITIRHLLEMTCGLGAYPGDAGLALLSSGDPIGNAISQPVVSTPGETWNYYNPATNILRGIIKKSTGMSSRDFAQSYLFDPLEISVISWPQDPQGYYMGNMEFYPRDMARIGYLHLNNGLIHETQILSAEFVNQSIQPLNTPDFSSGFQEQAYGFLWWVGKLSGYEAYAAMGWGGQNIFCIPALNMVVVTTADSHVDLQLLTVNELEIVKFVEDKIVHAAGAVLGPPPYFPLDFKVQRVENHSLLQSEFIDVLTWTDNSRNQEVNIVKYRVYRVSGENAETRELVAEIDPLAAGSGYRYWVRRVPKYAQYVYGITSVTADNKESSLSKVMVNKPNTP